VIQGRAKSSRPMSGTVRHEIGLHDRTQTLTSARPVRVMIPTTIQVRHIRQISPDHIRPDRISPDHISPDHIRPKADPAADRSDIDVGSFRRGVRLCRSRVAGTSFFLRPRLFFGRFPLDLGKRDRPRDFCGRVTGTDVCGEEPWRVSRYRVGAPRASRSWLDRPVNGSVVPRAAANCASPVWASCDGSAGPPRARRPMAPMGLMGPGRVTAPGASRGRAAR